MQFGKSGIEAIYPKGKDGMEVHFTFEQEARLSRLATPAGMDVRHFMKDAASRLMEEKPLQRRHPRRHRAGRPGGTDRPRTLLMFDPLDA
jgi:hypothetical protein